MKTLLFTLFTFAFILQASEYIFAQGMDTATSYPETELLTEPVFTIVEEMPEFPGGNQALHEFISTNIKYPLEAKKNNISGKVYVSFVVSSSGKIKETRILRGIGGGCDEEALRVVDLMPDWQPGKQNGKPVNVQYNLPILFQL